MTQFNEFNDFPYGPLKNRLNTSLKQIIRRVDRLSLSAQSRSTLNEEWTITKSMYDYSFFIKFFAK